MESASNDIIELLQYKGIYEILNSLRYSSRNYNTIKSFLSTAISSRTLDHRLADLQNLGLLQKIQVCYRENEIFDEYVLTETGILLECVLKSLRLENKGTNFINFMDSMKEQYKDQLKYNWHFVWEEIKKICTNDPQIYTLSTNSKLNQIEELNDTGILVTTEKNTELVEIGKIKRAYEFLLAEGELFMNDYEHASYRSSFVCALLSKIDWIKIKKQGRISLVVE